MDITNQLATLLIKLVILLATGAFSYIVLPWLRQQSFYWLVKRAAQAAEKLGASGAIPKDTKKQWVIDVLKLWGVPVDDKMEVFIESAVEELDTATVQLLDTIETDEANNDCTV
jgi:hypothetical protein